jgi:hypothetical protein
VQASARLITAGLFAMADVRVALVDYKDLYAACPSDGYAAPCRSTLLDPARL